MDLKTFVSEALVQISEGIKDAQNQTKNTGAVISPACEYNTNAGNLVCTRTSSAPSVPSVVNFDVLVTSNEKNSHGQGGKSEATIQVLSAKLSWNTDDGSHEANESGNLSASRIRFEVRVKWPEIQAYEGKLPR